MEEDETMPSTAAICVLHDRTRIDYTTDPYPPQSSSSSDDDDNQDTAIDSNPTATAVLSLHSDGTVRLWTLPRNLAHRAIQPLRVRTLNANGDQMRQTRGRDGMPPPHTWSSAHDSVSLAAEMYGDGSSGGGGGGGGRFVLGVCIRTAENLSGAAGGGKGGVGGSAVRSPCHLLLLDGDVSGSTEGRRNSTTTPNTPSDRSSPSDQFVRMHVPSEVESLSSMRFVPHTHDAPSSPASPLWELIALYRTTPLERAEDWGVEDVVRSRSLLRDRSGLQKAAMTFYRDGSVEGRTVGIGGGVGCTFDAVAEEERRGLLAECCVFMEGEWKEKEKEEGGEVKREIQRIDAWFMKRLFRPASARTMDGRRASDRSVRKAMNKVFPSRRFGGHLNKYGGDGVGGNIEVETIISIKEWTKMDEAKVLTEARWRKNKGSRNSLPASSSSTLMLTSSKKTRRTSSIYDAFRTHTTDENEENETMEDAIPREQQITEEDDGQDMYDDPKEDTERRIERYHNRWRSFMLAVWDEEAKLRLPLSLCTVPRRDGGKDGQSITTVVLLRAGATSTFLLSSPPYSQMDGPTDAPSSSSMGADLDSIALSILEDIQNGPSSDTRAQLAEVELQVWDLVSTAKLALPEGRTAINESVVSGSLLDLSRCALVENGIEDRLLALFHGSDDYNLIGEIESWLRTPLSSPTTTSEGTGNALGLPYAMDESEPTGGCHLAAGTPSNLARCATAVALRYTESIRRLTLARCLLVIALSNDDRFYTTVGVDRVNDSLRTYLHATSVVWLGAQVVVTAVVDAGGRGDGKGRAGGREMLRLPAHALMHDRRGSTVGDGGGDGKDMGPPSPPVEPPSSRQRNVSPGAVVEVGAGTRKETALYYKLLKLAERSGRTSSSSSSVVRLAQTFVTHTFDKMAFDQAFGDGYDDEDDDEEKERSFVELRPLPDEIIDKSQYTLRLLASCIAYPPQITDNDKLYSRYEAVAECLLTEVAVSNRTNPPTHNLQKTTELWRRASALLALRGPHLDASKPPSMQLLINALTDIPNIAGGHQAPIPTDGRHETLLAQMLHHIIDPTTSLRQDILSLSRMQTVKKIFLPWILTSQIVHANALDLILDHLVKWTTNPEPLLQHLLLTLLRISNLTHRVAVLGRHAPTTTGSPERRDRGAESLLAAVKDVVATVEEQFTKAVVQGGFVLEYAALWSSAFQWAVEGGRWEEAFRACLANPVRERRVKNFKRMVVAMVDAGEVGSLIRKIPFTVVDGNGDGNGDGGIDLYELAAETLEEAASQQSAYETGEPTTPGAPPKVDYMGCLYALHVASGDWRRSCHAMDYYGILKLSRFVQRAADPDDPTLPALTPEDERELGSRSVDALSLSTLACAQLIHLVENRSHRFIVSGELGAQPALLPYHDGDNADRPSPVKRLTKRSLNGNIALSSAHSGESNVEDTAENPGRLSYLYNEHDLLIRGTRMAAIKTLYMDSLSPDSLLDILQSSYLEIMDALSQLGYYSHTVSLAHSKRAAEDGRRPGGRDILIDAVSHLSSLYIAPSAVRLSRPAPLDPTTSGDDDHDSSETPDAALRARPTLGQIRSMSMASSTTSLPPCASYRSLAQNDDAVRGTALMELLRRLTYYYSSPSNSLAAELAGTLLDLDSGLAELPLWLTAALTGDGGGGGDGRRPSAGPGCGNPAVLVRLLMDRGLYVQACQVVCGMLQGGQDDGGRGGGKVTDRLPEEGSIDYVPYRTIDTLWDRIVGESSDPDCGLDRKRSIVRAQDGMEVALERHYELMKVSEIGTLSARALKD